ncbi:glycoside hydrolase family 6 protein [Demequina sp. NBRC 110054]|uniref:glycoside hydrolase family 6 protein n=1 Tax=Demequina sp. NBRC 110054 TaxID=1570343 RepID=UPI000A065D39|nr:glycoside hydrolase family 6 protein [Demequina sp. NBRC 110054]
MGGSARRRASVTAAGLAAVLALAACTGGDSAEPSDSTSDSGGASSSGSVSKAGHVDNPFAGATMYVNAEWSAQVEATAASYESGDPDLAESMRAVASEPTGVWMDRISAIEGNTDGPGLRYHLDAALSQSVDGEPVAVTVVVYDLPGRDCFALASNGELPATDEGLERYESEYIDALTAIFAEPEYADLRIVTVIEPDSLPNLVTNASDANCQAADPYYRAGIAYALDAFAPLPNVYSYIDAAHSGWLGWDSNSGPSVALFASVVESTEAGFEAVDGFVTNTANYTPTEETYLPDASLQVGGQEIRSGSFYEWNALFDEADWTADLYARAVATGFPETIGMLIDTSRNGWGGSARPTEVTDASSVDAYVAANAIDQRTHRGAWCNQAGAGLGLRPQALPSGYPDSHLDAYLWVKPPGESDGSSEEIANDEGKSYDPMCSPSYSTERLGGNSTGALADAPLSGKWFAAQFAELVANAYPAVGEENPPAREDDSVELGSSEDSAAGDSSNDTDDAVVAGAAGECSASLEVTNSWQGGFQANVVVKAAGELSGWEVSFDLPSGVEIDGLWNGDSSGTSGTVTVGDVGWNGVLAAGETGEFGFTASGDAPDAVDVVCAGN